MYPKLYTMSISTNFYFSNRVHPNELKSVIEKEFGVNPNMDYIRLQEARYEGDYDRYHGYISFILDNNKFSIYFYQHNNVYGGERDGTDNDTMMLWRDQTSVKCCKRIGKYFGGWLDESDSDDVEAYFIEKTEDVIPLSNEQLLKNLIDSELGYKNGKLFFDFLQKHEEKIREYNFGNVKQLENSL